MTEVKIPERYNYVEAYLTFRCNFKCPYCINNHSGSLSRQRKELTGQEWIGGVNRIDLGKIPITLGGGEPTLHPQFYEILAGIDSEKRVDLLTNLSFDVNNFIKNTRPNRFTQSDVPAYRAIRVSYHIGQSNPQELVKKARKLRESGFSIGIFGLDHPKFLAENMKMMELALSNGVFFFPKNFLGVWNNQQYGTYKYPEGLSGKSEKVSCRTRELLIDPSGNIYRCHGDLYRVEGSVGQLLEEKLEIKDIFRACDKFGKCNPCDIKLKTNFYLDQIDCQVEIKS